MRSIFLRPLNFLRLLFTIGLGLPVVAGAVDLQNLLSASPFSAGAAAGNGEGGTSALEFRGVFADQGEYFFSLYETSTQRALWVGLNEAGNAFTVHAYDTTTETVTAEYQGRALTLMLLRAKITALASAPAHAAPAPSAAGPSVPTQSPEAQIVEEIRRRRSLRQQTAPLPVPLPGSEKSSQRAQP